MKKIAEVALAIALVALGMLGVHLDIEYSGWILFIGLVICVGVV